MKSKRLLIIILFALSLLLIPLLASQFTDEVNWALSDFIVAGGLLIGTGLICELVIRKVKNLNYRIAFCIVAIIMLFLIWAELSVGIF